MAHLDIFTDEQRDLLYSMPYRTGLWISQSDDTGGDDADQVEILALESILTGFSQDFCKSEIAEELLKGTLEKKALWDDWYKSMDVFIADCQRVSDMLGERLDNTNAYEVKHSLIDIATTIAMAYREFDSEDAPLSLKMKVYATYYMRVFIAMLQRKQPPVLDEFNISGAENKAIKDLASALGYNLQENLHNQTA